MFILPLNQKLEVWGMKQHKKSHFLKRDDNHGGWRSDIRNFFLINLWISIREDWIEKHSNNHILVFDENISIYLEILNEFPPFFSFLISGKFCSDFFFVNGKNEKNIFFWYTNFYDEQQTVLYWLLLLIVGGTPTNHHKITCENVRI